jgi:hypothetical protein
MAVSQKLLTGGRDATCRGSPIFYWGEAEAKRLHRARPKTGERRSLRKIAAELAMLGHLNVNGRPFNAKSVRSMIEEPARRQGSKKMERTVDKPAI